MFFKRVAGALFLTGVAHLSQLRRQPLHVPLGFGRNIDIARRLGGIELIEASQTVDGGGLFTRDPSRIGAVGRFGSEIGPGALGEDQQVIFRAPVGGQVAVDIVVFLRLLRRRQQTGGRPLGDLRLQGVDIALPKHMSCLGAGLESALQHEHHHHRHHTDPLHGDGIGEAVGRFAHFFEQLTEEDQARHVDSRKRHRDDIDALVGAVVYAERIEQPRHKDAGKQLARLALAKHIGGDAHEHERQHDGVVGVAVQLGQEQHFGIHHDRRRDEYIHRAVGAPFAVEQHDERHRAVAVDSVFEMWLEVENGFEIQLHTAAKAAGAVLGVGEHVAELLKESADADTRQGEQQERNAQCGGSQREEQEGAQTEKVAVQRRAAALAEQQVRRHAQRIEQIDRQQKRTAEHSACKAQTAENDPQLFLIVGGRQQHTGKQHQLNAHGVVAERHDVVGRVEVIERTGDHGENAVFAQAAVEQHGRAAVHDDIENARRQNNAVGGACKKRIDRRERQQQNGRHLREVPFVPEQCVAHEQAMGDRLIKRLVVAAEAVAQLPERENQSAEQQRDKQHILPLLFVVACALLLDKDFYFFI